MNTGWRAYKQVQRPKSSRITPRGRISRKRRISYKNRAIALRHKGLL